MQPKHSKTYRSLQMQMIGRSSTDCFFFFFFKALTPDSSPSLLSFRFRVANKILMAAWANEKNKNVRSNYKQKSCRINRGRRADLTAGAPSISSIIRQLGFSLAPRTDFICVAVSMRFWKSSALRSSLTRDYITFCILYYRYILLFRDWLPWDLVSTYLALISTTLYPACFAIMCASVVFPSPGGPDNSATCGE